MRSAIGGPRVMLRRLREVMAEPVSAQERLDKIVVLVASNMVAEVCSVYVLRGDGSLELFATEGLNRSAVHKTRMMVGQGLVGVIAQDAEPLALQNAQEHPSFAYFPETGEEIFQSFSGVPLLRGGQTLGVLVVQNQVQRAFSDEETEALETVGVVLAEMIASGDMQGMIPEGENLALQRPQHLKGKAYCAGIALGHVVLHEPRVLVRGLIAEDVETERRRLDAAIESLRSSVDDMVQRNTASSASNDSEHLEILESYRMFAHDRGWVKRMQEAVDTGLTAEAAVERVQNDTRARLLRQTDPYIRERLHDLDDLANRLLRELVGWHGHAAEDMPKDAILLARNLGPAELLDYDRERLRGIVLEEGSQTSHATIVARALGIPTVAQISGVLDLATPDDPIIVDGLAGEVHLRPTGEIERAYADKVRMRARRQERYARLKTKPAETLDGQRIGLHINAGLLLDMPHLEETGADGVGLFRTELQFMVAETFPRMSEQLGFYREVLDAAGDRPVVFRSLDIGGDKILPYMRQEHEQNPAMGWRAIRIALDRPALIKTQVRALLHAAAGRDLNLMFPMISEVSEFDAAKAIVQRELEHLNQHHHGAPRSLRLGAMIEVPALLWQLDELASKADFLSVGSNDLFQFMFASDRENAHLANRFDPLNRAMLRALRGIVEACDRARTPLTLCGEMAGRPLEALALLGIGFRSLSLAAASAGPVKEAVRSIDQGNLRAFMDEQLSEGRGPLRNAMAAYAARRGAPVES
ncbi:MAG: phosphoenolpyruvate--protein phosphotransferase [Pseudomonadota bacterium]